MFIANDHALFDLSRKENLVKYQKVSKYCEHGCLQSFILIFMSLLTARIVKKSYIFF